MVWKGILLGIGAAAPIGPVNIEIARRALRQGFASGFLVGCGAVTVDVAYAIITSVSVPRIIDHWWLMTLLGIGGAALLAYLGIASLRSAMRPMSDELGVVSGRPINHSYVTGLLMTSLNPMTLTFWFVAVPGIAGQISKQPGRDLPLVCAGVFMATLGWVGAFTTLMSVAGRVAKHRTVLIADWVGGVVLLCFAAIGVWQVGRRFL